MRIVHGSPGFGSMLTEEQTVEFLTDKKLNLLLGTVGKNGDPFIHPVWSVSYTHLTLPTKRIV